MDGSVDEHIVLQDEDAYVAQDDEQGEAELIEG